MVRAFRARYRSSCSQCPNPIEVGDLVSYDDEDLIAHVDCVTDALPLTRRKPEVCDQCYLQKPCDCDEVVAA